MITPKDNIIIQGITGKGGSFQTDLMLLHGTKVVAGVTPGKGGQEIFELPVYNTVKQAMKHKPTWSVLFVPVKFLKQAALEALRNKLNIVIITEGVPVHDALEIINYAKKVNKKVLGPNCPGIVRGKQKLGIIPNQILSEGNIGIVSRSGTLTYEIIYLLTKNNMGQSACFGIGGDMCIGTNFIDVLKFLQKDRKTKKIVLIGEIGGGLEEKAAVYIKKYITKPVVAFIAGISAPKGKRMGHAGAIVGATGTAEHKVKALRKAGIKVASTPSQIIKLLKPNL
ncbi:MAG: succinate--CoA ligase subunit alpha [Candidatus Nanoarchaeia archaeon]